MVAGLGPYPSLPGECVEGQAGEMPGLLVHHSGFSVTCSLKGYEPSSLQGMGMGNRAPAAKLRVSWEQQMPRGGEGC